LATFEQVAQGRTAEAHDYYRTPRAMCPTAENKLLVRSFLEVLSYDALHFADKFLTQPLLLIVSEKSDTAYQAESILEGAASALKA
jgi:X-pro dipeptidyl-peptidase (S15 family) protein